MTAHHPSGSHANHSGKAVMTTTAEEQLQSPPAEVRYAEDRDPRPPG